jgi:hypothetical protein
MQERLKDIYERVTGVRPDSGTLIQPSIEAMMDAYEKMEKQLEEYQRAEASVMNVTHKIFDLEQEIMGCWNVVDDLKLAHEYICDHPEFEGMKAEHSDRIGNLLLGLETLYQIKFDKMFETFSVVCREYHQRGKRITDLEASQEQE